MFRSLQWRRGLAVAWCRVGGTECSSACMGPFEGSEVAQSCATLCYPMDCITYQSPPSMEFSRQEDWSGLPFPSPGDLPDLGDQTQVSCIAGRCFTFCITKETHYLHYLHDSLASGQTTGKEHSPVLVTLDSKWNCSLL